MSGINPDHKVLRGTALVGTIPVREITRLSVARRGTRSVLTVERSTDKTPIELLTGADHLAVLEVLDRITQDIWDSPIQIVCAHPDDPLHAEQLASQEVTS